MSRRLSLEFVRSEFEKEGYTLLSTEYKNSSQKLDVICDKGHHITTSWSNFNSGKRCIICAGKKKYTLDEVRLEFEKYGYKLLSSEYINNKKKLDVICPNEHRWSVGIKDFKSGRRCPICNNVKNTKLPIKYISDEFKKRGYTLLSKEYRGCGYKLKFQCPNNHIGYMTWNSFRSGAGCIECAGTKRKTLEEIKPIFEKEGYTVLSKEYKNNRQKLYCMCPNGHKFYILFNDFKKGIRCAECSKCKKKTIEYIKAEFAKEGYTVLSNSYTNNKHKIEFICANGHRNSMTWNSWTNGYRCSKCSHNHSKAELEIFEFVKNYFPDAVCGDKKIIHPYELDIVIQSKKIAIEYCGLYWHSELNGKDKNYHLNKLNKCNELGYILITIFEDEWINKKEIVLSRLKDILGINDSKKLYARQCTIHEIDTRIKNEFLEANHIQGRDSSVVKLGAFYKDKLVSVMTFSKGSIAKGKNARSDIWKLNRFCSHINYYMIGIASKLLKYFKRMFSPKMIYLYSDRRWSTDKLYNVLGFINVGNTKPNYWYIIDNLRIHRFNYRKNQLKNKLEAFDPKLSEWQNMVNNGFNRIWDCGNTKWVLTT